MGRSSSPRPPTPPTVDAVALGGLNEFGLNALALSCGDTSILIDAGGMIPPADLPGVSLIVPDLAYAERHNGFAALFLTHGHEDHIGAIPYILPAIRGPIYGTPLTLAFVELLLAGHGIVARDRLLPVQGGSSVAVGPFNVEFIPVTHSMPDCAALAIRTPLGTMVHSGDFKVDLTPVDGRGMALDRLTELGRSRVLALFSESTSAELPGHTESESSVIGGYREVFATSRKKIIVVTYASNLHLLQILVDLATEADRCVAFMGRRLGVLSETAERVGHLHIPAGVRVRDSDVGAVPSDQLVCVVAGSQGTPGSTLALLAQSAHRNLKIEKGDRVVFAAGVIPGNEQRVSAILDELVHLGAEIVDGGDQMHVSGHARQEELKMFASLLQPRYFVPIHGEYRNLTAHADLVNEVTKGQTKVLIIENGDVVRFSPGSAEVVARTPTGRILVEGRQRESVAGPAVEERRQMASDGAVFAVVTRRHRSGKVKDVDVVARGLVEDPLLAACLDKAARHAIEAVAALKKTDRSDDAAVKQTVDAAVMAVFQNELSKAPVVTTVVITV